MIANQTRAKTEQLAKTHWLIISARVLQAIQERAAVWVRNISLEILCSQMSKQSKSLKRVHAKI